jgi:hypothetical protein
LLNVHSVVARSVIVPEATPLHSIVERFRFRASPAASRARLSSVI